MEFSEKLLLGIFSAISLSLFISLIYIYIIPSFGIKLPDYVLIVIELIVFSVPFYFFLLNSEDSIIGFISAFIYYFLKSFIMNIVLFSPICFIDIFIFSIAFFIYSLAIAFHRETSLKNAKMSLLGAMGILLAFTIASFILIVYNEYKSEILCFNIYSLITLFRTFP